jgi:hypothetical protein
MGITYFSIIEDGTFSQIVAYYGGDILSIDFSLSGFVPLPTIVINVMNQHHLTITYVKLGTWKLHDFECNHNSGQAIAADVVTMVDRTVHMIHKIDAVI